MQQDKSFANLIISYISLLFQNIASIVGKALYALLLISIILFIYKTGEGIFMTIKGGPSKYVPSVWGWITGSQLKDERSTYETYWSYSGYFSGASRPTFRTSLNESGDFECHLYGATQARYLPLDSWSELGSDFVPTGDSSVVFLHLDSVSGTYALSKDKEFRFDNAIHKYMGGYGTISRGIGSGSDAYFCFINESYRLNTEEPCQHRAFYCEAGYNPHTKELTFVHISNESPPPLDTREHTPLCGIPIRPKTKATVTVESGFCKPLH